MKTTISSIIISLFIIYPNLSYCQDKPTQPNQAPTETVAKSVPLSAPINPPLSTKPAGKLTKSLINDSLVTIASGEPNGVYNQSGNAICRMVNKKRKLFGIRCAAEPTPGSIYNIDSLRVAEMDFGMVQSDWQEHAYNGTGAFTDKDRLEKLRFVFSLYNEAITIIIPQQSKIVSFNDLKGKIINIGPYGSGIRGTMGDIMKAKGWTKNDFKGLTDLKQSEIAKSLCNGSIDAIIMATGHPSELVRNITNTCNTRILNVNDDVITKFITGNPEFFSATIPKGIYRGVDKNINSFGVKATFLTTTDISNDTVYNITKAVFSDLEGFKKLHPVLANLDASNMITQGQIVPYHEGALIYYQQNGLIKN